jgi:hypothetical protein
MFWRNISPPSLGSKNKQSKKPSLKAVPCLNYSLTLKMEKICSPKRQLAFNGATRRYISENSTLYGAPHSAIFPVLLLLPFSLVQTFFSGTSSVCSSLDVTDELS